MILRVKTILLAGAIFALFGTLPSFPAGLDDSAGGPKLRGDGSIDDSQPGVQSDGLKRRGGGSIDDHSERHGRHGGDDHFRRGRGRDDQGLLTRDDDHRGRDRDRERERDRRSDDRSRSEARMETRERGESRRENRVESRDRSDTRMISERSREQERERERERGRDRDDRK